MTPSNSFSPNSTLVQSSTTKSPHKHSETIYSMASYQSLSLDSKVQGAYGHDNLMGLQIPNGPRYLNDDHRTTSAYSSSSMLEFGSWGENTVDKAFNPRSLTSNSSPGDFNSLTQERHQQGKSRQPVAMSSKPLPIVQSGGMYGIQGASSSSSREWTEYDPMISMGPGSTGTSVSSDDSNSGRVARHSTAMGDDTLNVVSNMAVTQSHPQMPRALPAGSAQAAQAQSASAPVPPLPTADQPTIETKPAPKVKTTSKNKAALKEKTAPRRKADPKDKPVPKDKPAPRKERAPRSTPLHAGRHTKTVKETGFIVEYSPPPEIVVAPPQAVLPSQMPVRRWVDSQVKQGRPVKVPLPKVEYGQQLEEWDIGSPVEQGTGERGEGNAAADTKGATSSASSGGKRKRGRNEVEDGEEDNVGPKGKKRRSNAPRGGTAGRKVAAAAVHQPEPKPLNN
ncbi:uncharacterized protein STEHIDRAFT_162694 [Stereum hirsutum FP-91666 SS1]|uniref:Uncharacterized protein n=1 Tax=Stereum hirsutum (strain FP-91666) TaxID=721885 RepID=R7RY64_STEHR|nr:uncharacterized protein STEHIDRAFT_162694 [Stereum hirsutum FP-91666 SS1]EIM80274.1 hypothetical protein STEHIDRAFT_162694 [Stereum hirsutum FP-91666 SS1]